MPSIGYKSEFFAVDDYGMGGIWLIVKARSAGEIRHKYPELTVFENRPDWMTTTIYEQLRTHNHFDIDDEPTGYLRKLVDKR
jgi:hypothetical protein